MRYKIGKVAEVLGISSQAIHLYEQSGIICCQKDQESGYRTFSLKDINILLRARLLKSLGFPLSQIADILNDCEEDDIFLYYAQQEAALQREMEFTRHKLQSLRYMHEASRWAVEHVNQFEIATRPEVYCFAFAQDEILNSKITAIRTSVSMPKLEPFLQKASIIQRENVRRSDCYAQRFFYLEKEFAELVGLREQDGGFFLPPQRCLHTAFTRENQTQLPLSPCLEPALRHMDENGMQLDGDIFIRIDLLMKRNTTCRLYADAWIPIR